MELDQLRSNFRIFEVPNFLRDNSGKRLKTLLENVFSSLDPSFQAASIAALLDPLALTVPKRDKKRYEQILLYMTGDENLSTSKPDFQRIFTRFWEKCGQL